MAAQRKGDEDGMSTDYVEVVIVADDGKWLADFTRSLVQDRLVACGQIIAAGRSIYRWDGEIQDHPQARVALHTRATLVPEIVARTRRGHDDDVPCVIAMPLLSGNPAYLRWISDETRELA